MNKELVYKAQTRRIFHANIKIKIPLFTDEALFDELFAILEDVNTHYNSYSEGSYFDLINKNAGSFIEVDEETIKILQHLIYFSDLFDGEYDITIMPLIRLWGFYKDNAKRVPSQEEIDQIKRLVDYKNIEINGLRVKIGIDQEIITGSFIKSYAADKLVTRIKELGITDAIINAGGSTIMAINDEIHPSWQVNINNPQNEEKQLFKLKLSNACFSTSAQTKTFVEIDDRKYGHIISPITGYPSENQQIGIISDNCFIGDVISTGLYNQTAEGFIEKMEILSKKFGVSGFLVDKHNNITYTTNFQKHIITE